MPTMISVTTRTSSLSRNAHSLLRIRQHGTHFPDEQRPSPLVRERVAEEIRPDVPRRDGQDAQYEQGNRELGHESSPPAQAARDYHDEAHAVPVQAV